VPQRGNPDRDAQLLPAAPLEFGQGQIGLRGDLPAQSPLMRTQAGAAIAADLLGPVVSVAPVLVPKSLHDLAAHAKPLAHFAWARALVARGNDALP
jgi:hypothetical protein